jgi:5-methylcytosine-specific restriction endonuclease McrA
MSREEIEDVQGRRAPVKGGGTCIYCGSDGGTDGLRNEHAVPYSLGGTAKLLNASCSECERVTSYLDGYLANATYKYLVCILVSDHEADIRSR